MQKNNVQICIHILPYVGPDPVNILYILVDFQGFCRTHLIFWYMMSIKSYKKSYPSHYPKHMDLSGPQVLTGMNYEQLEFAYM